MRVHGCGNDRGHGRMGRKMAMMASGMMATGMIAGGAARGMRGGGWGGWGDGPWGGDDDGRERGGPRGRGRSRMFAGGELRLLLLKLIADQSRHGYELIKAIEELTGGEYAPSPGVVYPTLSLLVDEGRIAEASGQGDSARKAFAATDEGVAELGERVTEADALVERLTSLARRERPESPPIKRAIANLFTALRHRMASVEDKETAHAIADILDEAARRIERL